MEKREEEGQNMGARKIVLLYVMTFFQQKEILNAPAIFFIEK